MSTPKMLDKLAALSDTPMALKELLRDIILNICAFCHYGERPGYPVHTAIDEDAYGPEQAVPVGTNTARYLTTTLNEIHLDQVRISIPFLGTSGVFIQININGTGLFPTAINMQGTLTAGPGTMKFGLADFAAFWQTNPIPDGSRIDVLTTMLSFPGQVLHSGLRVRMEGRWI
jgi:hypothetical protein